MIFGEVRNVVVKPRFIIANSCTIRAATSVEPVARAWFRGKSAGMPFWEKGFQIEIFPSTTPITNIEVDISIQTILVWSHSIPK